MYRALLTRRAPFLSNAVLANFLCTEPLLHVLGVSKYFAHVITSVHTFDSVLRFLNITSAV
jgi:hypothetical protein